jgi:hypothetical protein
MGKSFRQSVFCTGVVWLVFALAPFAARAAGLGTLTQVSNISAYDAGDTNSCAIDHNNLISVNFTSGGVQETNQFIAFYNSSRHIEIGRRTFNSSTDAWSTWTVASTSSTGTSSGTGTYTISSSDIADDHDVIALGIDPNGDLHMSWDMHNVTLNYALSSASVMGATFGAVSRGTNFLTLDKQTATTAPTLFASAGATTNEVTYPEFFNVPGTGQLIFAYRNGGAGGGSGNGNQYINPYDATTGTWTNNFAINGEQTSVNAYLNGFAYDSSGNLVTTWTWRASPNWQTNSNIMIAQSPNNGVTWYQQGGTTQYALPIIQDTSAGGTTEQVGQIVWALPQGTSFINQTSMAIDKNNRPIVATYWAPGANGTTDYTQPVSATNNPNLQYMLVYYDGTQWRDSQVSHRTSDAAFDGNAASFVRDLGRPIVLVDKQNRVLVVTRSEENGQGTLANGSEPGNNIVIYFNNDLITGNIVNDADWQSLTLDTANMGNYEPTYDENMWKTYGILDLFYEPSDLSGQGATPVSVLEWNEQQFFAVPEPAAIQLAALGFLGCGILLYGRRRGQNRRSSGPHSQL